MPRILFVSHTSDIGGPTYRLLKVVRAFRKRYGVAVVAPGYGQLFAELEDLGVEGYAAREYGLTRRAIPWLYRLITREGFDLVYGNNYSSGPRNGLIAAKLARKRFVWHINEMLRRDRAGQRRKTAFFRFADAIIADSQASADSVRRHTSNPVHQIYNGIDLDEFDLNVAAARSDVRRVLEVPDSHLVVVNAGIVSERKGQLYSLKAAVEILKSYDNVTFAFLGSLVAEPEYTFMLISEVERLGLTSKIRFLGFRTDFSVFMAGSDLFLHTPSWDPHPIVVLSAMAAKRPVVAFAVDGIKEQVIDGRTGFLISKGDVIATVKALSRCLDNPSLRCRMGEMGRQRVQDLFSADLMVQRINNLIAPLLLPSES